MARTPTKKAKRKKSPSKAPKRVGKASLSRLRAKRGQDFRINVDDPDDEVHVSHSNRDQVIWWSDKHKFKVFLDPKDPACREPKPFGRIPNKQFAKTVPSGPVISPGAVGWTYAATFEFEDGPTGLDPDVIIEA